MAAPTNHWKLGLFIVVGIVAALGTLAVLGARSFQKQTVSYVTFFDESVSGLDVGSPVKFRGVTVGNVEVIDIAADHRHVGVTSELGVDKLDALGLNVPKAFKAHIRVPPDLRMQLASAGVTGVKFILIDFFPVSANPPPDLPFPVPENYVPAASSTMKNVEDAVVKAVNRIPELAEEMLRVLNRVGKILEDVDNQHVPSSVVATMTKINQLLSETHDTLHDVGAKELSREAQQAIASLNATVLQMGKLIDRIQGKNGVLAGAERTSNALGEVAHNASGLGPELVETLRGVQEAAATIQRLGDALDRDGDMLLKGRSKRK